MGLVKRLENLVFGHDRFETRLRDYEPLPDNHVDMSWVDRMTPFEEEVPVHPAQQRLAEVEQVLADHARSEGRKPSGSVRQQVEALIDRLHEQDKQEP